MAISKKKAGELFEFIQVCRGNDYTDRANNIYTLLGEKFEAASSSDVINNPAYAEEIEWLIKVGFLSTTSRKVT